MTSNYGFLILGTIAYLTQMVLSAKEKIYYADFERANVTYWNPKYLKDVDISCRRYGRKDPVHYCSVHGETLAPGDNNILLDFYVYEFLSNEYRPSFVELHIRVCDLFFHNPVFKQLAKKLKGLPMSCPLPKTVYHIENVSVVDVPILRTFPFRKGRVFLNISGKVTSDSPLELIGAGYVDGTIKQMWR